MLNQNFMRALAKLESVSATDREKAIINSIRGLYVDRYGRDNQFVSTLAQLESVAATNREKAEINTIRGKFGLMEMTDDLSVRTNVYGERSTGMDTAPDAIPPVNDPESGLAMTGTRAEDNYKQAIADQTMAATAAPFKDTLDDISLGSTVDPEDDWSDLFDPGLLDDPETMDD